MMLVNVMDTIVLIDKVFVVPTTFVRGSISPFILPHSRLHLSMIFPFLVVLLIPIDVAQLLVHMSLLDA